MSQDEERARLVEKIRGAFARALDAAATDNEARAALEPAFRLARKHEVNLPELARAVVAGGGEELERVVAERVHEAMVDYDAKEKQIRQDLLRRAIEKGYQRGQADAAAALRAQGFTLGPPSPLEEAARRFAGADFNPGGELRQRLEHERRQRSEPTFVDTLNDPPPPPFGYPPPRRRW